MEAEALVPGVAAVVADAGAVVAVVAVVVGTQILDLEDCNLAGICTRGGHFVLGAAFAFLDTKQCTCT